LLPPLRLPQGRLLRLPQGPPLRLPQALKPLRNLGFLGVISGD
jgi:hypothetical protein